MSESFGTTIGPYEIERELGRGGMGVVYLGRDTRLDRPVAIKALPELLASDPERLARFEREAKTLAQLNHPNVAGIHGVEERDGTRYLVLEYVEGETLAERLDRGALPVDEAIEIAVQIAAGVEAAHDAGVVHRDLKPGNVIITPEGKAKVLDFGLARTEESQSTTGMSEAATLTSPAHTPTLPGVILGTAAYMSPEQARGRRVDKRTDIWSFGVMLYEMLAGASPFVGETVSDSIGAVLHKQVDLELLPPNTPPAVRRVISRCVERDKSLRYRDIGDVRIELLRARDEPDAQPVASKSGLVPAFAVLFVIAVVAAVGWYLALRRPGVAPPEVRKFDVLTGTEEEPLADAFPRISPDGKRLAYIGDGVINVRDFTSFESRPLPGTDGAKTLFWSPDSRWIGFTANRAVNKVALLGGGAIKIGDMKSAPGGITVGGWTSDGRIIFRDNDDIYEVAAHGGELSLLLEADADTMIDFHDPTVITGTNIALFIEHRRSGSFAVGAYDGERRAVIFEDDDDVVMDPMYSPTGHVLFVRGYTSRALWAIGFDPERMEVTTEPFLVLSDAGEPSVSNDGTLAAYRGDSMSAGQLVWASASGGVQPIGDPLDLVFRPVLSPDGTKIALSTGPPGKFDVWVHDLNRGTRSRITFLESMVGAAGWSPDGSEIAVLELPTSSESGVTHFFAADGSGQTRPDIDGILGSFDAQWKSAIYESDPGAEVKEVGTIELDDPTDRTPILTSKDLLWLAQVNPAGTLLAYSSNESGQNEIFCTRFPSGKGKWQVSTNGGGSPQWSPDGATLYYSDNDDKTIYAVSVTTEPSVVFGMPEPVLDADALGINISQGWSVTDDGQRFVAFQADEEHKDPGRISVVEHWYEEYRGR